MTIVYPENLIDRPLSLLNFDSRLDCVFAGGDNVNLYLERMKME